MSHSVKFAVIVFARSIKIKVNVQAWMINKIKLVCKNIEKISNHYGQNIAYQLNLYNSVSYSTTLINDVNLN